MEKSDVEHRHAKLLEHGLQHVLSSEAGRAWYLDLITKCGFFHVDALDPHLQFFSAGKRNIGLMLYGQALEFDKDSYLKMIQEDANRKEELRHVTSTEPDTSTINNTSTEHAFGSVSSANSLV